MQSDSPPDSITGPAVPVAPPGPSPDARTLVGRTLGRYQLVRVVGRGAMGVVYEGFDTRLGRTVAIKTVLRSFMADEDTAEDFGARFEREAQAAARLNHPNIVALFDFGEQGDISYIVMEMIRGRELAEAFKAGDRFSMPQAQRLMTELLDALGAAHDSGIVHRDVKPANVLIDESGRVKLADFGVARVVDRNQDRTLPGTLVGTPSAMAPEQIMGLAVGSRTDIFSAGLIFYQLLTGKRPFTGSGPFGVQRAIVHDEAAPPSTLNPDVPKAVDAVLAKSLAKKPEHRYESAAAFAAAITAAMGSGLGAPPVLHAAADPEDDVDLTMVLPKPWLDHTRGGSTAMASAATLGTQPTVAPADVAASAAEPTAAPTRLTPAPAPPPSAMPAPVSVPMAEQMPVQTPVQTPVQAPEPLPLPVTVAGLSFPPAPTLVPPAAVPATAVLEQRQAVESAPQETALAPSHATMTAAQPWRGERSRWPLWLLMAAAAGGAGVWWTWGRAPAVQPPMPSVPAAGTGAATNAAPPAPVRSTPLAPPPAVPATAVPTTPVKPPSSKTLPPMPATSPAAPKPGAQTPNAAAGTKPAQSAGPPLGLPPAANLPTSRPRPAADAVPTPYAPATEAVATPVAPAATPTAPAPSGTAASPPPPSAAPPSATPPSATPPITAAPAANPTPATPPPAAAPKPTPAGDAAATPPARAAERRAGPNDPRCAELRARIQLGDTLTPEQTTLFHTRCAR